MKQILYLLAFSLLLFISCGGKQSDKQSPDMDTQAGVSEYPQTILFETGIATEKEVLLSQIARNVKIVPLETKPECLVAKVAKESIRMVGSNLFIPCSEGVLQFTDDGKFVRSVAKRGQGPGEYNMIRYVASSEASGQVYIMDHGKILAYSVDGTFREESKMPYCWQFTLLNDSTFVGYTYNNTGQKKDKLILVNQQGDTLNAFPQYDQFTISDGLNYYLWGWHDRYVYSFKGDACCKEYYNDTVFTITPEQLNPRYIMEMGKYKIPKERRFEVLCGNWDEYSEPARAYLRPDFLETSNWVFLPYTTWDVVDTETQPQLAIYDKKTKECYKVKDGKIKNDVGGNLPFYPAISIADDVLLYFLEATEFIELAEEDPSLFENEQLKKVKEDDNPILMIVHLK